MSTASTGRVTGPVAARAPGRVNLMGEHTDYNDGLCLPIAIPYDTTVTATRRGDDVVTVRSVQAGRWEGTLTACAPGRVEGWAAYPAGVLWALTEAGHEVPGVDLEVDSTVPLGAGLSSSAALECAVAVAVTGLLGLALDHALREHLVAVCRRAETEVVGAPTGGLDQTASLLAPDDGAILIDFGAGAMRPVELPLATHGLSLLVVDTRVSHDLTDGAYGSRRRECEQAASALRVASLRAVEPQQAEGLTDERLRRRARHVLSENDRVLATVTAIEAGDWERVGRLLTASHRSMRDDFEISCEELDLAVETALVSGALGARMTGGGFGGSAIVLVPSTRDEAVRRAIDGAFAARGLGPVAHLDGTPSAPASRV